MERISPECWFLTGHTASGKSRVAVEMALRLGAEIISLDSMTVYRGMDIGTAKPTPEERQGVPHHLLDVVDPNQLFTLHDLYDLDPAFRPTRTVLYSALVWRWLALVSTGIICVSETTFNEAVAVLRWHRRKMRVIKEASRFPPVATPAAPAPYFLFVANVQKTKNVECLLRAAELASGEGRPLDIRLIAVTRQPPAIASTTGCRSFPQRRPAPNGSSHTTDVVLFSGWL